MTNTTTARPVTGTSAEVTSPLRDTLRQTLAGLDLDLIMGCASNKAELCGTLADVGDAMVDEECRALLDSARRLNEANRRVRNLIAANVSARLDALTGSTPLYRAGAQVHRLRSA